MGLGPRDWELGIPAPSPQPSAPAPSPQPPACYIAEHVCLRRADDCQQPTGHSLRPVQGAHRSPGEYHACRHQRLRDDHADHANHVRDADIYLEFSCEQPLEPILDELRRVPGVRRAETTPSFSKIYGKRIIIMGGGAQVGQVALGAIAEADRHNIRGERISVDTIPLVGEEALASAVRAVVRLPRVRLLVLAGSLMGGDIAQGGRRGAAEGADRHLAEHGGQRARRGRSGRVRSGAGRRHGGDGDRRHGQVRHRPAAEDDGTDRVRTRPDARICHDGSLRAQIALRTA